MGRPDRLIASGASVGQHDCALLRSVMRSPVGDLALFSDGAALRAVLWPQDRAGRVFLSPWSDGHDHIIEQARHELGAYFEGSLRRFTIALNAQGTAFQHRVWRSLQAIPFGSTRTYGEIGAALGMPGAARAVGAANTRNPLSIIIPCHRLVGANGALTGFAGGLSSKAWLLGHEQHVSAKDQDDVPPQDRCGGTG